MEYKTVILFASHNKHKYWEISSMLGEQYELKTLSDLGFENELDEPYDTLEVNAQHKAKQGFEIFKMSCFAEDAGLEIDFLHGAPGVRSARYAGPQRNAEDNIDKVLFEMKDAKNRSARFRAVISYFDGTVFHSFEGIVNGQIASLRMGANGFGYDPIFIPEGYAESFAEMTVDLKNSFSHRGLAIKKFINFLKLANTSLKN